MITRQRFTNILAAMRIRMFSKNRFSKKLIIFDRKATLHSNVGSDENLHVFKKIAYEHEKAVIT